MKTYKIIISLMIGPILSLVFLSNAISCPRMPGQCGSCQAPNVNLCRLDCRTTVGRECKKIWGKKYCTNYPKSSCGTICFPQRNESDPGYLGCLTSKAACNAARNTVSSCQQLTQQARNAQNYITSRIGALNSARRSLATHVRQVSGLNNQLAELHQTEQTLRNRFNEGLGFIRSAETELENLGANELVLYDISTRLALSYNASVGTGWYRLNLPVGLSLDHSKVKEALAGSISTPDVEPIELIKTLGPITASQKDDYDSWAKRLRQEAAARGEYIYVSSRRFVDNVSPERIASSLIKEVFLGGQGLKSIGQAIVDQVVLEWTDIVAWLESIQVPASDKVAGEIIRAIVDPSNNLSGSALVPSLKFGWGNVGYSYEIKPHAQIGKALDILAPDAKDAVEVSQNINHMSFWVSLKPPLGANSKEMLTRFNERIQNGPNLALQKFYSAAGLKMPFPLSGALSAIDSSGNKSLGTLLTSQLNIPSQCLDIDYGGTFIDLADCAELREPLEDKFSILAMGNNGSASLDRLTIDLVSTSIEVELTLHHSHSWGTVENALNSIGETAQNASRDLDRRLGLSNAVASIRTKSGELARANGLRTNAANVVISAENGLRTARNQLSTICRQARPRFNLPGC